METLRSLAYRIAVLQKIVDKGYCNHPYTTRDNWAGNNCTICGHNDYHNNNPKKMAE